MSVHMPLMETHKINSSKTSCYSTPSVVESEDTVDTTELRKQLSSVAWVQCDNSDCLKWRKVDKEVTEDLGDDDPWTCSINKDPAFQCCAVPEEDTAAFDKLAKKANLDLIKSELKQGSLVWAKIDGFCSWPALITEDPLNGCHFDGDDEEIFYYHAEFLGEERSHGWVLSKRIEVFGKGNCDLVEEINKSQHASQSKGKQGRKKGRSKVTLSKKPRLKSTYKGNVTVQKAVSEALRLLPLSCEERLKTCWFLSQDWKSNHGSSCIQGKKAKTFTKDLNKVTNVKHYKNDEQPHTKRSSKPTLRTENAKFETENYPKGDAAKCQAKKRKQDGNESSDDMKLKCDKQEEISTNKKSKNTNKKGKDVVDTLLQPKGLGCVQFPSSLIGSSKEERFILDVQMYLRNEKAFEEDVARFMSNQGLSLSSPPTWNYVRVSMFSIFLAVYERGGFEKVCDNHQWSSVYCDVVHHFASNGSSTVKKFYQRNLYAYELYATGQDYSPTVKALQQNMKPSKTSSYSWSENSSQACSSTSLEQVVGVEDKIIQKELKERNEAIDEVLEILAQEEKVNNDHLVPDIPVPVHPARSNLDEMENAREEQVDTGSGPGAAVEPEEKAQVVPELDFPSSEESSEPSDDLHEMQALQMELGALDEQIDIL